MQAPTPSEPQGSGTPQRPGADAPIEERPMAGADAADEGRTTSGAVEPDVVDAEPEARTEPAPPAYDPLPVPAEPGPRTQGPGFWRRVAVRRRQQKADKNADRLALRTTAARLDSVDARLASIEARATATADRLGAIEDRIEALDAKLETRIDQLEGRFVDLWAVEERLGELAGLVSRFEAVESAHSETRDAAIRGVSGARRLAWAALVAGALAVALGGWVLLAP